MHTTDEIAAAVRQLARSATGYEGPERAETSMSLLEMLAAGELDVMGIDDGEFVWLATGLDRRQVVEVCA